jgi:hypothetical protein
MRGVLGEIDLITTTLGKALGGASGGCVSGRRELVAMCRQRARPYLFSNTVAPVIVAGALEVLELLTASTERRDKLEDNARYWRKLLTDAGFDVKPGESPIVPVMLYNAKLAQDVARDLFAEGIYVVGFFFPVVPKGQARIRTQLSAAHERRHLDRAIEAFVKVGTRYGVLGKTKKELVEPRSKSRCRRTSRRPMTSGPWPRSCVARSSPCGRPARSRAGPVSPSGSGRRGGTCAGASPGSRRAGGPATSRKAPGRRSTRRSTGCGSWHCSTKWRAARSRARRPLGALTYSRTCAAPGHGRRLASDLGHRVPVSPHQHARARCSRDRRSFGLV